jgi:hypothetical protein
MQLKEYLFQDNIPPTVTIDYPTLTCYNILKWGLRDNASRVIFLSDKVMWYNSKDNLCGSFQTPRDFTSSMVHIISEDKIVSRYVKVIEHSKDRLIIVFDHR